MQCFILQIVVDTIGIARGSWNNNVEYALTSETLDSFVQYSRVLQKRPKQKWNEAVSAKKTAKHPFFSAFPVYGFACKHL